MSHHALLFQSCKTDENQMIQVDCLKKTNRRRPVPGSVPKNYQILKKNRFINKYKYCQPLTPNFRYYDEVNQILICLSGYLLDSLILISCLR